MFEFLMVELPAIEEQAPKPVYDFVVSLIFKENGVSETVNFHNYDVFKWIESEVVVKSWKIREIKEREIEVITEGTTLDSYHNFVKESKFNF